MRTLVAFLLLCSSLFAGPAEDVEIARSLLAYRRSSLPVLPDDLSKPKAAPVIKARVGYPVRADWNNTNGDTLWFVPPQSRVEHMAGGAHYGKYDRAWLQGLTHPEIESLHKDDHAGRVHSEFVVRPTARAAPTVLLFYAAPQYSDGCINGQCPAPAQYGRRRR